MPTVRTALALVLAATPAACALGYLSAEYGQPTADGGIDAAADSPVTETSCGDACAPLDAPVARCKPDDPFGPVHTITLPVPSNHEVRGGHLAYDEASLVWASGSGTGRGGIDLLRARRRPGTDEFVDPELLAVSSEDDEWPGSLTADGGAFVFARSPKGNLGFNRQLERVAGELLPADGGGDVVQPSDPLFSLEPDAGKTIFSSPFVLPSGAALYFVINDGFTPVVWRADATGAGFGPASVAVRDLNAPVVSSDERTMYGARFEQGRYALHVLTRPDTATPWTKALDRTIPEITSTENTIPTWLSPDGCELWFNVSDKNVRRARRGER